MPVKLTARQYIIIAISAAVAAVSLAIGLKYFSRAFPEATLHLRVNRSGSEAIAQGFLASRGFHLTGYRHAAIFEYDDTAKLYLERTQGLNRMDQLTSGPVHLWRWSHRWFKPQQKEEFSVDVTPEGAVVGFDHLIPEAAPGANLDQSQARAIAESFLRQIKRNLNDLEFLEADRLKRPARTDYTFIWKQKSINLGDGSLRIEVDVDDNQVAGYNEFVKIPESWVRGYQKVRSHNDAVQEVDQVFWALLILAMLIILVRRLRDRDVPFRLSIALGGTAAVLEFLSRLNTFPVDEFSYNTTDSFSSFLSNYVLLSILGALGIGTLIFLVVASAEPVYRESLPGLISFRRYFSWKGLRTRSFFIANVVGVALTFFFFAYQTIFYLIANHFGAWAPSDIPFSNQLNTHFPWVAVLFTGFFPAVSEEMQFRAFAIPFLKKITRSWPLAIILAAFNWGFLHSAYPNQPFFIRGLEVGVGGIIIGVIMLRFGIIATLMWHYSVDALYEAFLLLRSSNHYLMFSGGLCAGIMLIPLIVALAAYLRTGVFTEESPLTNASEGVLRASREPEAATPLGVRYQPLASQKLRAALVVIVVFAGLAFIKVDRLGKGMKIGVTRAEALQTAGAFLRNQQHADPATYHSGAWLDENIDPLALRYFLERLTVRQTDHLLRETSQPLLWETRFYRPLEKEEYLVFVNAVDGKVYSFEHLLPETAPGATLMNAQAIALGEQVVRNHGYRLVDFALQDSEAQKRPAREDYMLIWQAKQGDPRNVGEARYRLRVEIAGNQVLGFYRFFKLPEAWLRQQETTSFVNSLLRGCAIVLGIGLIVGAVWLFVLQVRKGIPRWIPALKVAVALTFLMALFELNSIPAFARVYDTSISLSNFRLQVIVSYLVLVIVAGALMWLLVALAASFYPESWRLFHAASRRVWRRDAAIAVAITLAVGVGLDKLIALAASHFPAWAPIGFPSAPSQWGTYSPGAGIFLQGLFVAITSSAALALAIYGVMLGWRRRAWWFWAAAALLLISLAPWDAHTFPEFAFGWILRFIPLLAAVVILVEFFRDNPLAYVTAAFCSVVVAPAVGLLSEPVWFYRMNGILLAVLSAIALIWLLAPSSREGTT